MTIEQYPSSNNIASTVIWKYTGQGTELVLSGTDSYGQVLNFTPGSEQLFLNGVLLVRTQDYTPAANGLSITLPSQLAYGDFVQIYCYSNYSISTVASSAITGSVQNTQLTNSTITIGNQAIALGQTITIPTGLTLSGATNTFSNIPNSALTNSTIIINGNPISLGASVNITTPNNILANKGGLIVGTGGGSVTQLGIGTDGAIALADSNQTSGINWSGPHNLAGKNLILNGGFDSWSLGTSFTTDLSYTADRWYSRIIGAQSITQETSDLPSTNTRYGLKWNTTASTSGFCQIHYPLDSATIINLRGKVLTFSFYAKISGGYAGNIGFEIKYSNSIVDAGYINGATAVTVSSGGFAAPTTWTRLSYTFTVPSDAVSLYVGIVPDTAQSISGQTVRLANVQLEVGPTATNFTKAFSTLNGDTAASGPSGFDGILASSTPTTANAQGNPPKLSWAGYDVAGKNKIINGGFDIWQRGNTISGTNNAPTYAADRWNIFRSLAANYTLSRIASDLPGFAYYARFQRTAGDTLTSNLYLIRTFESIQDVIPLQGKTVTISFYARKGANYSGGDLGSQIEFGTGTDTGPLTQPGSVSQTNASYALTTLWARYSTTVNVPTTSTAARIFWQYSALNTNAAGAADYFDIAGVQLEVGSTATQFSRAGGTYDGELKLCQRYFCQLGGFANYDFIAFGNTTSTTNGYALLKYPTRMRVIPTFDSSSNLGFAAWGSSPVAISTVSWLNNGSNAGVDSGVMQFTGTGFTILQHGNVTGNGSSGYVRLSAEIS